MLRHQSQVLVPVETWSWRQRCPGINRRVKRSFYLYFLTCRHSSPSPVPFCGSIFLGARFRLVSFLQIWVRTDCAREVHTFEGRLAMDPFIPEFFCDATCPWRIWRRHLISIFRLSFELIFSDENLATHNPIVSNPLPRQVNLSHHFSSTFCWAAHQPQRVGIDICRHNCIRIQACNWDTREGQ